MVRIDREMEGRGAGVHAAAGARRAVFEAPPDEAAEVAALAKREMEQVSRLEVPLLVDVGIGDNWRDAK